MLHVADDLTFKHIISKQEEYVLGSNANFGMLF
jgi:hypothetical protein